MTKDPLMVNLRTKNIGYANNGYWKRKDWHWLFNSGTGYESRGFNTICKSKSGNWHPFLRGKEPSSLFFFLFYVWGMRVRKEVTYSIPSSFSARGIFGSFLPLLLVPCFRKETTADTSTSSTGKGYKTTTGYEPKS